MLLGAAAFGVYHSFSCGVFGSVGPMLFIFAYTGASRMQATGFVPLILDVACPLVFIGAKSWYLSRGAVNDGLTAAGRTERAVQ